VIRLSLFAVAFTLCLTGCFTTQVPIDLETSPSVLRGDWKATLTYNCQTRVDSLAWKPDGTRVAAFSGKALLIWDAITGTQTARLQAESGSLLGWSGDDIVVSSFEAGQGLRLIRVNAVTGESAPAVTIAASNAMIAAVSANLERLVLRTFDASGTSFEILNTRTGALVYRVSADRDAYAAAIAPDGSRVYVASNGEIRAFDAIGTRLWVHKVSPFVTSRLFAAADRVVIVQGTNLFSRFDFLNPEDGALVRSQEVRDVGFGAFSADGLRYAAPPFGTAEPVAVYDLETGSRTWSPSKTTQVLGFSPDGTRLVFPGTLETCALEVHSQGTPSVTPLPLDEPELRPSTWTFTPSFQSGQTYKVDGRFDALGLEGYTVSGIGTGADCVIKGFVNECSVYVKPAARAPVPEAVLIELTKAGAPTIQARIERTPNWQQQPQVWTGYVSIDERSYQFTLEPR
jgi:WD40 repeat protein